MDRVKKSIIYLDTHVALWFSTPEKFSKKVKKAIDRGMLYVSPMVELELQYLYEIGRIRPTAELVLQTLEREVGLQLSDFPFREIVKEAKLINWTRDPFDRLIVAEATIANAKLITKDETILKNFKMSLW